MTISLPLQWLWGRAEVSLRVRRWEELLDAAITVPYYQPLRARLEWARHVSRQRLHPDFVDSVSLATFYERAECFRNTRSLEPEPGALEAIWPARRPVALGPWFRLEPRVEVLPEGAGHAAVVSAEPDLLAGSVESLRALATDVLARKLTIPSLKWGVIAFTGIGRPVLLSADRNLFWWAFQMPLFEQYRGFLGELLATECQTHDCWHLVEDAAIWQAPVTTRGPVILTSLVNTRHPVLRLRTGLRGRLSRGACACGRTSPRLLDVEPAMVR